MSEVGELSEAEEKAWCVDQRRHVVDYLATELPEHGEVGDWPGWFIAPIISVWAVESLARPGFVGWWVVAGDLPCDYCAATQPAHPRKAIQEIGERWAEASASYRPGDAEIGETGLPGHLAEAFAFRAEMLRDIASDDIYWEDD